MATASNKRSLLRASGVFQAGFCFSGLFNLHVAELFGVKDIATIQALDKLGVFVPGTIRTLGCLQTVTIARLIGGIKYSSRQIVSAFPSISN